MRQKWAQRLRSRQASSRVTPWQRPLSVEPLERREYLAADLTISEFVASNSTSLIDSDGAAPDWLEIHNRGDEPISLLGWSLTDDATDLDKWRLPYIELEADGYLVVFASGKDRSYDTYRLTRDAHVTPDGTFLVDLPDGNYEVRLTLGDATDSHDGVLISMQGESVETVSTPAGEFVSRTYTAGVDETTGGQLAIRIDGSGGSATGAAINALIITPHGGSDALKFDFGRDDSPLQSGFQQVTTDDTYTEATGFGWMPGTVLSSLDGELNGENVHTNFRLQRGGEYVALVSPLGEVVSEFGPNGTDYPEQSEDVSYGIGADGTTIGYLLSPTPGDANTALQGASVTFDQPSRVFDEPFTLRLSVATPSAVIHFTTDGSEPTEASPVYEDDEPLTITSTTLVQAIAVGPGAASSTTSTAWYVTVDSDLTDFSSNLPVVVLENFGARRPSDAIFQFNAWAIYEPDPISGRTTLDGAPDLETRAGLRRRGSSTLLQPKFNYALEAWDEHNDDKDVSPLGLPAESDWILYAPYGIELNMIRNPFMYELARQMGRYAVRTRFVEVFHNMEGGDLSSADYRGVYVFTEKIKRGPDRVDIADLRPEHNSEPEISGGWILEASQGGAGVDVDFEAAGTTLYLEDPKPEDVTPEQLAWITNYFNRFRASLTNTDPETGYAAFIDVDSWIEHHILEVLSLSSDALSGSQFIHKDRGGKIALGPEWDYDRALDSTFSHDDHPDVWAESGRVKFFGGRWWGELFQDPAFLDRWWFRWFELREDVFSDTNIISIIDSLADQIVEAQARNFQRWPDVQMRTGAGSRFKSGLLDGSWRGEVEHMKAWVLARLAWIDTQAIAPPTITPGGSQLPLGSEIVLAPDTDTIYYTTDGSDPRLPDGQIRPTAVPYNEAITYVSAADSLRYLVPSGAASETGWQTTGFDDAAWNTGTAALGFDTGGDDPPIRTESGFTVREVASSEFIISVDFADALLRGEKDIISETTVTAPVINFYGARSDGHYGENQDFPNGGGNNFALHATATMVVDVEGTYTLGVSNADSFRLKIDGTTVLTATNQVNLTDDHFVTIFLSAGTYSLDLVMSQFKGGVELELFYASGRHFEFSDRFQLVGDTNGQSFTPWITTDIQQETQGTSASVYTRIPFVASANVARLNLRMHYDDGFIAYLNGTEVARRNAPDVVDPTMPVAAKRANRDAVVETIDISPYRHLLREGDNLLAVHGLNAAASNPDFLLSVELVASVVRNPIVFSAPIHVNARVRSGDVWGLPAESRFIVAGTPDDVSQLAITEINYHPYRPTDDERSTDPNVQRSDFEFIEMTNLGTHTIDLAGVAVIDGVQFAFPQGGAPTLAPGEMVLLVRNPAAFEHRYGNGLPVVGQFADGRLNDNGERIALADRFGNTILEFEYQDTFEWPSRADGRGSSLEWNDRGKDLNDPANWRSSGQYGGTPGGLGLASLGDVIINEILARSGGGERDQIELFNTTSAPIDLSRWMLSNDGDDTAGSIPNGTVAGAGQYIVLDSSQTGLTLDGTRGGQLLLIEATEGTPIRFADDVTFHGTLPGVSIGRWPNGSADDRLFPMTAPTFGSANSGPVADPVIVTEVHYNPGTPASANANFDTRRADGFQPQLGSWTVANGRFRVTPVADGDTLATLPELDRLTSGLQISAIVNIPIPVETQARQNAAIVFDYHSPTDFKFALIHTGDGTANLGQRDAEGWKILAQSVHSFPSETDIPVSVVLEGSIARVVVSSFERARYDFGTPLHTGLIGLGSRGGEATFDEVQVTSLRTENDFEFVELVNTADTSVDLGGWQLAGGVDFVFPSSTSIGAGESLVVVRFDPADSTAANDFRTLLGLDPTVVLTGPLGDDLANTGDLVELLAPLGVGAGELTRLRLIDRIRYDADTPWPVGDRIDGKSLHRMASDAYGDFPSSWWVSDPTPGLAQFGVAGDLDQDGQVSEEDIEAFVLALVDRSAYEATYGVPAQLTGDFDRDGDIDFDDINGFVLGLMDPMVNQPMPGMAGDTDQDGDTDFDDIPGLVARLAGGAASATDGLASPESRQGMLSPVDRNRSLPAAGPRVADAIGLPHRRPARLARNGPTDAELIAVWAAELDWLDPFCRV